MTTDPALSVKRAARSTFETAACWRRLGDNTWRIGLVANVSFAGLHLDLAEPNTLRPEEEVELRVPRIGEVTARVVRAGDDSLGLSFGAMDQQTRDRLVHLLSAGSA